MRWDEVLYRILYDTIGLADSPALPFSLTFCVFGELDGEDGTAPTEKSDVDVTGEDAEGEAAPEPNEEGEDEGSKGGKGKGKGEKKKSKKKKKTIKVTKTKVVTDKKKVKVDVVSSYKVRWKSWEGVNLVETRSDFCVVK